MVGQLAEGAGSLLGPGDADIQRVGEDATLGDAGGMESEGTRGCSAAARAHPRTAARADSGVTVQ
jgi:hypothetical protein